MQIFIIHNNLQTFSKIFLPYVEIKTFINPKYNITTIGAVVSPASNLEFNVSLQFVFCYFKNGFVICCVEKTMLF